MPQQGGESCKCDLHVQEAQNLAQLGMVPAQEPEQAKEELVVHIVALKYGRANQITGMVQQLLARRGTELRLVSDERTNSVIVSGTLKEVEASKALILALDTEDESQRQRAEG
ncbi:MAG: secretin N-terminal domain-containing protein [Planctomycetota bacterium]